MHVAAWYRETPDQSWPKSGNNCWLARPITVPIFVTLRQKVCEVSAVENLCSRKSGPIQVRGMSIFHETQMAIFRYCVRLQSDVCACYRYCACGYDLDPIHGQGQGRKAFELPKISEAVHAGGNDRQPPGGAFWLNLGPNYIFAVGKISH